MRRLLFYVLCLALLLTTMAIGWWTTSLGPGDGRTYRVQPGDTPAEVAKELGVSEAELARANGTTIDTWTLVPGTEILVPERPVTVVDKARFHGVGLVCQLAGLLAGFLLALGAGLLPGPLRGRALTMTFVLAFTSYFFSRAATGELGHFSPQLGFDMAKDGFAWSAAVALLARAIGIRETPPSSPAPPPAQGNPLA